MKSITIDLSENQLKDISEIAEYLEVSEIKMIDILISNSISYFFDDVLIYKKDITSQNKNVEVSFKNIESSFGALILGEMFSNDIER